MSGESGASHQGVPAKRTRESSVDISLQTTHWIHLIFSRLPSVIIENEPMKQVNARLRRFI